MAYSHSHHDMSFRSSHAQWQPARRQGYDHSSPVEQFFGNKDLAMYKDKPHSYLRSKRNAPWWRRKRALACAVLGVLTLFYWYSGETKQSPVTQTTSLAAPADIDKMIEVASASADWTLRQDVVREVFEQSWNAYEKHAWGMDEFHPLTRKGSNLTPNGVGSFIIDALDTLMIMNLTSRVVHAREWISSSLNFVQDTPISAFAATAHLLGGLLSAHYLSTSQSSLAQIRDDDEGQAGEDLYIERAADLANRLVGAYSTKSNLPYPKVKLSTRDGILADAQTRTGELAGMQLELRYMAHLVGETVYWQTAEGVMSTVDAANEDSNLVRSSIHPDTGAFDTAEVSIGPQTMAYYSSLLGQYLQSNREEPLYRSLWDDAVTDARKFLVTYSKGVRLTVLAERPELISGPLFPKMQAQACEMASAILLGATEGLQVDKARRSTRWGHRQESELQLARELIKTCRAMQQHTTTKMTPSSVSFAVDSPPPSEGHKVLTSEKIDFNENGIWRTDLETAAGRNDLTGEDAKALFYMFRLTNDTMYREWGWELFCAYAKHAKAADGVFAGVSDVNAQATEHLDELNPAWFSQTLKFFYLLFGPVDLLPLNEVVFTAGGHVLPVFKPRASFKTGWSRKEKSNGDVKAEADDNQEQQE